jgi:hypothetical protein
MAGDDLQCELRWKPDGAGIQLAVRCGRSLVYKRVRSAELALLLEAGGQASLASAPEGKVSVTVSRVLLKRHDLLSYQYTVMRMARDGSREVEVPSGRMFDTRRDAEQFLAEAQRGFRKGRFVIKEVDYL